MADQLYGWYSRQASDLAGSCWWTTPNGKEVEITSVGPEDFDYRWPDKYCRGPVVKWSRDINMREKSAERRL